MWSTVAATGPGAHPGRRTERKAGDNMRRQRTTHRRDWRRLWRYCRCGYRWRCPGSLTLVPLPWQPPHPRRPEVTPDPPLPPARLRPLNRGPLYPDQLGATAPVVRSAVRR